jgi:hypothetical protein
MTEYEAGYLQALKDVQKATSGMVRDPGISEDGKLELLRVVSYLDVLIQERTDQPNKDEQEDDAPEPLSGSY